MKVIPETGSTCSEVNQIYMFLYKRRNYVRISKSAQPHWERNG
jgi:hypothetical protein